MDGAIQAHALATAAGYPRADELADAVALHLDVTVPLDAGGRGAPAPRRGRARRARRRAAPRPARSRAAVLGRHPRDGLAATLVTLLGEEAVRRPRSRTGVMQRRLGFTDRVVAADTLFCR